jgi:hypothetical protein
MPPPLALSLALKEPPQAGAAQLPSAAGASEFAGATMSAFADIRFCRAKSALQNLFQNETPSLSLRLSGCASGDASATNGNRRATSGQHRCTLFPFVVAYFPPLVHVRGNNRQQQGKIPATDSNNPQHQGNL